jgi:D-lactate dehydrogenase
MRVAVFNTKKYDREFLDAANGDGDDSVNLHYLDPRLDAQTAPLAAGCDAVCAFVNDRLDAPTLAELHRHGVRLAAMRCAGFNNVDIKAAARLGIEVARVPAYSPYAVAEHAVGLMLMLNRRLHRSHTRVRERNLSLDGLLGFDMHGKTVGLIGTGKIGECTARILAGFGCRLLAYDIAQNPAVSELGATYVSLEALFAGSDIISLHCPLTPQTHHLIDADAITKMRDGAMLINTSRGALIDTRALIAGLKQRRVGYVGLDVYEEEADIFFEDLSDEVIEDDVFARLLTFPNVVVTGHQAFFTREALTRIAATTIANLISFRETGRAPEENRVVQKLHTRKLRSSDRTE